MKIVCARAAKFPLLGSALASFLVISSIASAASSQGRVLDREGRPIAGAEIFLAASKGKDKSAAGQAEKETLTLAKTRSDEQGRFALSVAGDPPYALFVRAEGFGPKLLDDRSVDQIRDLEIVLRAGMPFYGQVLEKSGGTPIEGARVEITGVESNRFTGSESENLFTLETITDGKGFYSFSDLAEGGHDLLVTGDGYAKLLIEDVDVGGHSTADTLMYSYLAPGVAISGRVVDPEGQAVSGARIRVQPARTDFSARGRTWMSRTTIRSHDDGTFHLDGIPLVGGGYHLTVEHARFAKRNLRDLTIGPSGVLDGLLVEMEEGQRIVARLMLDEQTPFDGTVSVLTEPEDAGSIFTRVWLSRQIPSDHSEDTLIDGVLTLEHIPAGSYRVSITPEGYAPIEREGVVIVAGETYDLGTLKPVKDGVISGRILDQEDRPVAEAEVSLASLVSGNFSRSYKESDQDGRFEFVGLSEAAFVLTIESPTHQKTRIEDVKPDGEPLEIVLEPAAKIIGRVVAGDPPQPIRSYRIEALGEIDKSVPYASMLGARETKKKSIRNEQGVFEIDGLMSGKHNLRIHAAGFMPLTTEKYEVESGMALDLGDLYLERGAILSGTVRDAEGSPIAGAVVSIPAARGTAALVIRGMGEEDDLSALTSPSGAFEIAGLSAGDHRIRVEHDAYAPYQGTASVSEGALHLEHDIVLAQGGRVQGIFRSKEGEPVVGGIVMISQGMVSDMRNMTTTDSRGYFEVENLPAGSYQVMGMIPSSGDEMSQAQILASMQMTPVTVADGETSVVNLPNDAGGIVVQGRVLNGKEPVSGSMFWTRLVGGRPSSRALAMSQADVDGRFQIRLAAPGEYQVSLMPERSDTAGASDDSVPIAVAGFSVVVEIPEGGHSALEVLVPQGVVSGRVYDEVDGEAISGVVVRAAPVDDDGEEVLAGSGGSAQTDEDGHFEIRGLGEGRYDLYFGKPEHAAVTIEGLEVDEDDSYEIEQALGPAIPVELRVSDPKGRPIQGATVIGVRSAVPFTMEATDENGEVEVRQFGVGVYDLAVTAERFAPHLLEGLPIDEEENRSLAVTLSRGGSLRMRVLGADKNPITGATIEMRTKSGFDLSRILLLQGMLRGDFLESDTQGEIVIPYIEPGRYEVEVFWDRRSKRTTVEIEEGEETVEKIEFR